MSRRLRPAPLALRQHPLRAGLATGLLLGLALLLWAVFAPASVGGAFSYVVVRGDSMGPSIEHGDVVLLDHADDYEPGDVVAYRHPELGVVLHRITHDNGSSYTVQGDNRNTPDTFQPTTDDIIGRGTRVVPSVGLLVHELQSPRNALLLLAGAIGLGVVTRQPDDSQRGPRRRRPAANDGRTPPPLDARRSGARFEDPRAAGPADRNGGDNGSAPRVRPSAVNAPYAAPFLRSLEPRRGGRPPRGPGGLDLGRFSFYGPLGGQLLAGVIALMLLAVGLPLVASSQGSTELTTAAVPVGIEGSFRYGPEADGRLFAGDPDAPPQPVFRALSDAIPVVYEYTVASESAFDPESVTGSYELVAEVRHANGWREPIVIQPTTLFAGDHVALNGTLDLAAVDVIIDRFEGATGISSDIYELGIVATIAIEGELAGQPFNHRVVHPIGFRLTELQLQFDERAGNLELIEGTTVTTLAATARVLTLPFLGIEVPYTSFPRISAAILVFCGFSLAVLGLVTYQTWRAGEGARIRSRYDHLLVEVASDRIPVTNRVLRVARFSDLVRVAEREGLPILAAGPPLPNRVAQSVASDAPYPNSPLRRDPRGLIEAFLGGDPEALAIVEGARGDFGHVAVADPEDTVIDLSGQYFVIDGDLTYRYIADELLPGSRFERYPAFYDEAA